MPPYIARPVYQLDGSQFQHGNCVAASDAMLLERSTLGAISVTGGHVRADTGDTSGGLTLDQVRYVNRVLFSVDNTDQENRFPWADLPKAAANRGFILLGRYSALRGTRYDCFRGQFSGNHALWANHRNPDGSWHACDPGADGRPGVPLGYMDYPDAVLREFAADLLISTTTSERLGDGWGQVLFSRPDAPVTGGGPSQPVVVEKGPATSERNAMISSAYGTSASRHMTLAKGQPCFRYPGGPQVTKVSAQASVPFIGNAGAGWVAVLIGTGAPYRDKVVRPTVLYVPAAAGPVN